MKAPTHDMPASTVETSVAPLAPATFTDDDLGTRRYAGARLVPGRRTVACRDAGHDGPVAVAVDGVPILAGQVRPLQEAAVEVLDRAHAGVEDGDGDAGALDSGLEDVARLRAPHVGRVGRRVVPRRRVDLSGAVGGDGAHAGLPHQVAQAVGRHGRRDAVDDREPGTGAPADPATAVRTASIAPCEPETTTRSRALPVAVSPGSRMPGAVMPGVELPPAEGTTAREDPARAAARAAPTRIARRGGTAARVQALERNVAERDPDLIDYLL